MSDPRPPRETPGQIAWSMLLRAQAALVRRIDQDLAGRGVLSTDLYDVLLSVQTAPGQRLRLSELADRVLLSRSGLTRLVDRCERQGLLVRERCPEDRRGAYAVLTDAGLAALRKSWPLYRASIEQHFVAHLRNDEAQVIGRALARVLCAEGPAVELTVRGAAAAR